MNEQIYQQIDELQAEITKKRKEINGLRQKLENEEIQDYSLRDAGGQEVLLSSLFDDRDELLVVHNMGKACKYCTLWADEINGVAKPLADRVPIVIVSPDSPGVQQAFAAGRGWTLPMLSAADSTFTQDMGFYKEGDGYWPGVSSFIRKEGKIYRHTYDHFGPGDTYSSVWHFYDLLPKRVNGWQPKYDY